MESTAFSIISENDDIEELPVFKTRNVSTFEKFSSVFDMREKAQLCF
jgi:hypothetical protein